METARKTRKTSILTRTLAAAAVVATCATIAATPAQASADPVKPAGISVCLGIWANGGQVKLQHISRCGPSGTYHIRIWGGGRSDNGDNYTYVGALREFKANWPVPAGTNICAELWYHKPGGGYSSWGLPCDPM